MYDSNLLHPIQDPVNGSFLFTDCPGNNNFRSIMGTVKCVTENDCKERGHLIVDLRILGFLGFRKIGQELLCDPSLDHSSAPP